jgi:hypothetical protein
MLAETIETLNDRENTSPTKTPNYQKLTEANYTKDKNPEMNYPTPDLTDLSSLSFLSTKPIISSVGARRLLLNNNFHCNMRESAR